MFVKQEFDDYLKCGLLEHGFLRVKCGACSRERLVAFSCKRRGFCPSCGARRMIESAAHLVDHVLPEQPVRQRVLMFPYPLRFLFAAQPHALSQVLGVIYHAISTYLIQRTGFTVASGARTGTITLIQRFDRTLNQKMRSFDAELLLDFFTDEIGPYFYNQGLWDAWAVLLECVENMNEAIYAIENHAVYIYIVAPDF